MPWRDGTGPWGYGPMTGRGMGPCGRGLRWGFGRGFGRGMGWMAPAGYGPAWGYGPAQPITREQEIADLKAEREAIERELGEIKARIQELEKEKR